MFSTNLEVFTYIHVGSVFGIEAGWYSEHATLRRPGEDETENILDELYCIF